MTPDNNNGEGTAAELPEGAVRLMPIVRPDVFQAITLDDILTEMVKTRQLIESEHFEGKIFYHEVTATTAPQELRFRDPDSDEEVEAVSLTIYNKGSSAATLELSVPGSDTVDLDSGDTLNLSFEKARRRAKRVGYKTASGTATLRIIGQY